MVALGLCFHLMVKLREFILQALNGANSNLPTVLCSKGSRLTDRETLQTEKVLINYNLKFEIFI